MSDQVTIIIHSYNFDRILDCVKSALFLSKHIKVIGEEARPEVKKELDSYGTEIIFAKNSGIVESNREFGIGQAKTNWIFLLDTDEILTPELAKEITNLINPANPNTLTHFKVPRKEIVFQTKWLKHGGWWPNYQIRLIKKESFVDWPAEIHSTPQFKGNMGYLHSPLLHYSQNDFSEIVNKTIIFEDLESDLLFKANKSVKTDTFFRKYLGELYRRLIKNLGFLDGEIGIIESIYQAFSKTITYLFLYEKKNRRSL